MNFPAPTVVVLCKRYGPQLHLPEGIDGAHLMYAFACNESGLGKNCGPRHEPAYDNGGHYATGGNMPHLLGQYGSRAACSYGPWQVMYCNASQYTPDELLTDAEKGAQAFVHYFNSWVIATRKATTVKQMAEAYNSGTFKPDAEESAGVLRYAADLAKHYAESIGGVA